MTPFEQQVEDLRKFLVSGGATVHSTRLQSGAYLVEIRNFVLPVGWNQRAVTLLFVAPAGYPSAMPDCFWVEPTGLRLANGGVPQNTNDANPIPEVGLRGTWFSWHVRDWNPNQSSLITYYNVIRSRLDPSR
jgi:hypothetical protein